VKEKAQRSKRTARERVEARARRFTFLLKQSGAPVPRPDLVKLAIDRATIRETEREAAREETARIERERFAGCACVTDVARELGIKRAALFEWMEREGWLVRIDGTRRAGNQAVADEYVVERGPRSIRWVHITPRGKGEIVCRLGINPSPRVAD
jgi:transposase-like protein